jgi:cytochrome oxidase Cu insertion factor (SCO1/SenC/PrrC family)
MSKGRVVAQKQTRARGGRRLKRSSLWVYFLVGGLALAVAVSLSVYFTQSGESSPSAGSPSAGAPLYFSRSGESPSAAGPPSSGASLNAAAIGQPAPGFSLPNQYGQTYTLTPGDGKNHLLVFYMGNF